MEVDPHAQPIPWRPPTRTGTPTIARPVELGVFEDGSPVTVRLAYRHTLIGGVVGSGKSGVLNVLLASLTPCPDVALWGVDLKGGMELQPWAASLERLATTPADATDLLRLAVTELDSRAIALAACGERLWVPTADGPALVIVIDEYAELPDDARKYVDSIARRGRAVAVTILAATQRPTQRAMGHSAVRSQMDIRICLRVRERRDADLILGQGMTAAGWHPDALDAPGKLLLSDPEHTTPRPARAYLVSDDDVRTVSTANPATRRTDANDSEQPGTGTTDGQDVKRDPDAVLLSTLEAAPVEGLPVAELIKATGMSRPWVYRRLTHHAAAGKITKTRRGRWTATAQHDH